MRFTLKLSFAAALVSVALTGCKSTDGIRVVEKAKTKQAVTISNESAKSDDAAKSDNVAQPTAPQTAVTDNAAQPTTPQTAKSDNAAQPTAPQTAVTDNAAQPTAPQTVVSDNAPQPTAPQTAKSDNVAQPTAPQTAKSDNAAQPTTPQTAVTDNVAQPTTPQTEVTAVLPNNPIPQRPSSQATLPTVAPVNEDGAGKNWRVISLSKNANTYSAGEARRVERDHFLLPESATVSSPFVADEEEKEQNGYLVLDLGTREEPDSFVIALQKDGANYLGQHTGQVKPTGWVGEKIVQVDEDGNVRTEKADALHYLYVNQPFSSYGAFYTNENDSNLFHLRLSTGREGQRQQDGSSTNFAEYEAFSYANGVAKWNEGLVGELTYHGNVIARVEHTENGKTTATAPQFDGEVKLTLNLNDAWEKNKFSGEIHSQTLGTIQLNEAKLPDPRYLRDSITFNGEPTVKNNEALSGFYSTQFVGDKLHDAVGTIELESDLDEGITKYNAVFGGMKQ